tara:strand:+ start:1972 stop:4596 length:2625 start_codon:yes stop_codon:yes gene_type:complete
LKNFKKKIFFLLIGVCLSTPYNLNLQQINSENNRYTRDSEFSQVIGIMVDFQEDIDPNTTGNGKFLQSLDIGFIDSDSNRCDGFIVDPPPHNRNYFESQIQAVKNYYSNVSNNQFSFDFYVIDNVYTLSKSMKDYSVSDDSIGELFEEGLELAQNEITSYLGDMDNYDDILFVVFHAGVGQDVSFPYVDPTNYDIPSAYVEESMLSTISLDSWISQNNINRGIILPESLNHIYYDIIEDLFYGLDNYCDYQIGMTGLFSLLMGYALNLPPLYNTDNGRAGVGVFGLMDYGSNNGYGVIPSPPSPWTKIYNNWSDISYANVGENFLSSDISRIDIGVREYILIENRNNWIFNQVDIDSLRNKHKIWNDSYQDSIPGHFFDVLVNNSEDNVIVDPNTQVILSIENYDYGIPGSGIVIWHVNESLIDINLLSQGINNDPNNKAIKIKEADGSMDIGFECYHWNPSFCNTLTTGWEYDIWFNGNESYDINNPNQTQMILNDYSNPNTMSDLGSLSSIQIDSFSDVQNPMSYNYSLNHFFETDFISNSYINIIGSGLVNDEGCIFYTENNSYWKKCYNQAPENIDLLMDGFSNILIYNNEIIPVDLNSYIDGDGQVQSNLSEIGIFGYVNSIDNLEQSFNGVSAGDIDGDGLDEIVIITDQGLDVKNQNDTSVNGFPIEGVFDSAVLIANILNITEQNVELIVRQDNSIVFLSTEGELIQSISSNSEGELRLVPWGESIGLIDGNKILIFNYDEDMIYWSSKYGTDWNYPMTNPNSIHQNSEYESNKLLDKFYNFPNPVRSEITTFRFLYSNNSMDPKIAIYNSEGSLQDFIEPVLFSYQPYEYNEIEVDLSQYKTGVYFAELKDGNKSLGLIKVAVIK